MGTPKIMATRSLDATRELFSSHFPIPQEGYDFYSSIVEDLNNLETSGKDMLAEILKMQPTATPPDDIFLRLGVNMGFALVAIAYGLQAIREDSGVLRRSGTKNRVSVYHDAPLMTSTARYFLNQLAINAPSTYLHRGCFK